MGGSKLTTFYVKNDANVPVYFNASVLKHSQITGPFIINNNFTVPPKDSILVRQTYFKKDGENPQGWFQEFQIMQIDSVKLFDPKKAENWIKGTDNKGKPFYTFTVAE